MLCPVLSVRDASGPKLMEVRPLVLVNLIAVVCPFVFTGFYWRTAAYAYKGIPTVDAWFAVAGPGPQHEYKPNLASGPYPSRALCESGTDSLFRCIYYRDVPDGALPGTTADQERARENR